VRGPAPSITCPRCDLDAPPADTLGKLTTCTRCGLSFDAAPRERLVSAKSRRAPEPAPEPDDEPPPRSPPKPARAVRPLFLWLGAIALLLKIWSEIARS
jgi:hypothetical protein